MFGGIIKINIQSSQERITNITQNRYDENQLLLNLSVCEYWSQILFSRDWSSLKILDLRKCRINSNNVRLLLGLNWPQLSCLNLSYNQLNSQEISLICKQNWPKLQSLDLSNNKNLGDQGLFAIFIHKSKQLKELSLCNSGITWPGIKQIINCQSLNIRVLSLSNNMIGNSGIKWLIKLNLSSLNKLSIEYCKIQTQGFKNLVKADWPNLTHLKLDNVPSTNQQNRMGLDGWNIIHQNQWKNMELISIVKQQQPINYLNLAIMQDMNINEHNLQFHSEQFLIDIMEIIRNRNLLDF